MKKSFYILSLFSAISILALSCDPENPPVDVNVPATAINLDKATLTLVQGDSAELVITLTPANSNSEITWKSSNEKVATIENGKIKTTARGTSTITATANGFSAKCNLTVTREDLPYQMVWSEEFDGPELDLNKWRIETGGGGWGNQEKQFYTNRPENLRIENGVLVIEGKKETYQSNNYTSARINTKGKASFKYGRIEARISMPQGKGTWPAFWMLGANIDVARWPLCGEIDIVEHIGSDPRMVSHALHTSAGNGTNGKHWHSKHYFDNVENNFNTYAIEWEEKANEGDDCINFYFNDVKTTFVWEPHVDATVQKWPFKQEFFIILNLALGGTMGGTLDDNIFNDKVLMKVDYVRVYQRK